MRFVTTSLTALLVLLAAVAGFAQLDGSRPRGKSYVTTDVVPTLSIPAGQTAQAELRFRVNPGYHVNSHTPGSDLLIPTTLEFKPLEKIKAGKIVYPPGQQLALQFSPKDKLDVYSGDIVTQVPVIVAKDAATGQYSLKGELQYQACNDNSCFPPKSLPVEITVVVKK
jgi:DsbC/DsbD-like thiol-disulfide interchange protein